MRLSKLATGNLATRNYFMPLDPIPTLTPISTPAPAAVQASDSMPPVATPSEQSQTVTIAVEQLQQFAQVQSRLAQLEAEQRQREEAVQAEQARLLAAKGQVEEALKSIQSQSEAKLRVEAEARLRTEERAKRYALDNELNRALSMHPLLPGTVDQLAMILRGGLQVQAEGESYVVRTPTFVSVSDHVAQTLGKPEFAHFLRPSGAGGTAGTGATQAAPTPAANPTPPPEPKNFGEAIILQMKANSQGALAIDPRLDMKQGFGLGRNLTAKQA